MTTAREHAVRLAVLKAIKERVEEVFTQAKADAFHAFTPGDRVNAATAGDAPAMLGVVTLTKGRAGGLRVTDERAFTAWVREVRPSAIVESVRKSDQDSILKNALVTFRETGELPPGVDEAPDGDPYFSVRPEYATVAQLDWRPYVGALDAPQRAIEPSPCPSPGWRSPIDNTHTHVCTQDAGHGLNHQCECGARWTTREA